MFLSIINFLFETCLFQIGDYHYDDTNIRYSSIPPNYPGKEERTVLLQYDIDIKPLKKKDTVFRWPAIGSNYSLAGFEIHLTRHVKEYIIDYYLTSGLFVIVSWVRKISIFFQDLDSLFGFSCHY